jgi:small-conductance mechanosensitive channel
MGEPLFPVMSTEQRLDRIENILEVLAREALSNTRAIADNTQANAANAQAIAANAQAIAQMTEGIQQLKRTVDYLMSQDGGAA